MAGTNLATAFISIVPTVTGLQGNIAEAFRPAEVEGEAAGMAAGTKFAVAAGAALVASAAVVGVAFKQLFDVGAVFDDVSDTIRAGTGKSGDALTALSDTAKQVATTVPTSFQSAADTVTQLSQRMGLSGDALSTVSQQFLAAGNVLGEDVNVDAATKALNAFGVQGDAVSGQMDVLFRVAQSTGVGMNELTSAASAQAPAMKELGFNFQDTVALVGSLDKAGLNSTATMASMSKGLVKMAKDGEDPQQAFQRITGQLGDLVAQGDTAAAIDLASGVFGTKGATQFVGAIQSGTLSMDQLTAAAANTGDTILGVQSDTADAAESWTILKNKGLSALQPLGDAVFNLAGAGMSKLSDAMAPVLERFGTFAATALPAAQEKAGEFFDGLLHGGSNLEGVFGPASPLNQFGATLHDLFAGVWDTIGPIFQQVGGVLGAAFVQVWHTLQPALTSVLPLLLQLGPVFNPISLIFKALLPVLPQIADLIGRLMNIIGQFVAGALTALAPLFQKVVDVINQLIPFITQLVIALLPPLMSLFDSLAPLLQAVLNALMPVVSAIIDALMPAIDALMPVVERVFTFIATTIQNAVQIFQGIIDFVTGIFTGDWDRVWTGVKEIFGGIWNQIQNIVSTVLDLIVQFFTNIGPTIWNIILSLAGTIVSWGEQFLNWLWDGVKNVAVLLWDWFSSLPGWIWDKIAAGAGYIFDRGAEFIGWIKNGIVAGAEAIWSWFTNLPGMIWDAIKGIAEGIMNIGKQIIDWIVQGIEKAAQKIADAVTGIFSSMTLDDAGAAFTTAVGLGAGGGVAPGFGLIKATAAGGGYVIPGYAPGVDNYNALLSPGEAVMVPEFVKAVGPENIYKWNREARGGRPVSTDQILGKEMFADGGVFGVGKMAGEQLADSLKTLDESGMFAGIVKSVKDGIANAPATAGFPAGTRGAFMAAVASQMGTEYSWGGASPPLFDCSGLMSWALQQAGAGVGRLTAADFGDRFPRVSAQPGDMALFDTGRVSPKAGHIGMVLDTGAGTMMHTDGAGPARTSDYTHRGGLMGFIDPIGGVYTPAAGSGGIGGLFQTIASKMRSRLTGSNAVGPSPDGSAPGSTAGPFNFGGGVEQWRGTVLEDLALLGQPASFANQTLMQMNTESSGIPAAINLTDSNARAGTPSKGLLQVIDPTFAAMRAYSPIPLTNIWDPKQNILAGMLWEIHNTGSLANWTGHAYDDGGWLMPGGLGVNLGGRKEAVLNPQQSDAYVTHAQALEDGFAGRAPVIGGDVNITMAESGAAEVVDEVMWRLGALL